jgi:hypothetical protein
MLRSGTPVTELVQWPPVMPMLPSGDKLPEAKAKLKALDEEIARLELASDTRFRVTDPEQNTGLQRSSLGLSLQGLERLNQARNERTTLATHVRALEKLQRNGEASP